MPEVCITVSLKSHMWDSIVLWWLTSFYFVSPLVLLCEQLDDWRLLVGNHLHKCKFQTKPYSFDKLCNIAGLTKHMTHLNPPPKKQTKHRCPFYNVHTTLTSPWLILRSTIAKLIILAPFLFLAIWRIFALFSISSLCPELSLAVLPPCASFSD